MPGFLVDEHLPRSLVTALASAGLHAAVEALVALRDDELRESLVIIEPGRIHLRRA